MEAAGWFSQALLPLAGSPRSTPPDNVAAHVSLKALFQKLGASKACDGALSLPSRLAEVSTGAEFQINEAKGPCANVRSGASQSGSCQDGVWNTYFLPGANIIDKRTVEYGINDKYYLMLLVFSRL